jgi:Ca-activated chloride channel family protein
VRFAEELWLLGTLLALGVGGLLVLGAFLHTRAVARFGDPERVAALATSRAGGRRTLKGVLLVLALALAFVALAQPQYGRGSRLIPATDLDVTLVLDYSKSMYARDVAPSRIERAKAEVGRLIAELPGARFGAVAFAGDSIAFPLTSDGGAIAQFFRQLSPNDMPVGGTAIARALEAGRELFARDPLSKDHRRVMVLVTDGEDLEGDPVAVATAAHQDSISVYVVQIGGRTPEPLPEVDDSGRVLGYRNDEDGKPITTSLTVEGEEQLTKLAESGGGIIVRSERGQTGIEEVANRLKRLMSEELSERVEDVYADVFAYPLALAILLLLIESFISEGPKRASAVTIPVEPKRKRRTRGDAAKRAARAALTGLSCALFLALLGTGCERTDRLFERESPVVNDAIDAYDAGDAGAAVSLLESYLLTGNCEKGQISTPEPARTRPNAAFDLGLGLFELAEQFGQRFGEEPLGAADAGLTPEQETQREKRGEQVDCASTIVRLVAGDATAPIDLRARAFYLAGNLEFLRGEYRAAVAAYDAALKLVPGLPEDAGVDGIGRDAAHNRAIAQRRLEDEQKDAGSDASPDASEQPDSGEDGGNDQPDSGNDGGDQPDSGQDDQKDAGDDGGSDQNQKPDAGDDQKDAGSKQDQQGQQDKKEQQEQQEQQRPQQPQQSPDDRLLDQFEQAPTLQQQLGKRRGQRVRASEDK